MTRYLSIATGILVLCLAGMSLPAQEGKTGSEVRDEAQSFVISLEFRPRTEYRNGYRQLRNDTTNPAFFTEQRSRLNLTYTRDRFIFHTSIQDIRVWGESDPRSTGGTIQVFEAYVEPSITGKISARIGRQRIMYDNQRLFAQNDWRQNAGSHDAVRFMYKGDKFEADLIGAFNQEQGAQERFFETKFSPGFSNYKALFANFLKYRFSEKFVLTTINAANGFQEPARPEGMFMRYTSGGRVESTFKRLYLTTAAYYQYGSTPTGGDLSAYYVQPEVKYQLPKYFTFRLGAEIFSGDDATNPSPMSHSFDALYGVNHRFLGSMDFFTRFPKDFNNAGIIAPYFFTLYDVTKKLTLRTDEHLFFSQNNFAAGGQVIDKYLCFENDLLMVWNPRGYIELQLGYSYALLTESMEYIKGGGNSDLWHDWAFLMITFDPEIFRWTRPE